MLARLKIVIGSLSLNDVQRCLEDATPADFMDQEEKTEDSIMHYLAECSDLAIVNAVITHVHSFAATEPAIAVAAFAMVNFEGNTPLHLAALHGTYDTLKAFLNARGKYADPNLRQPNNKGEIPLSLFISRQFNPNSKPADKRAQELLEHHTLSACTTTTLSQPVDEQMVLAQYPEAKMNNALRTNLILACRAVNATRQVIVHSNTHISSNDLSPKAIMEKELKILELRARMDATLTPIVDAAVAIKRRKTGNCGEAARFTLFMTKMIEKELLKAGILKYIPYKDIVSVRSDETISFYERLDDIAWKDKDIIGSDRHIFNVIGRNPNGKIDDFSTYGEDAVVYCAHTGVVLRAKDIAYYALDLITYYPLEELRQYHISTTLNMKNKNMSIVKKQCVDETNDHSDISDDKLNLNNPTIQYLINLAHESCQDLLPKKPATKFSLSCGLFGCCSKPATSPRKEAHRASVLSYS